MKRLVLEKTAKRRLALDNVRKQLEYFKYRAVNGHRGDVGWLAAITDLTEIENAPALPLDENGEEAKSTFTYRANIDLGCFSKRARRDDVKEKELEHITKMVQTAGAGKDWAVLSSSDLPKDYVFPEDAKNVVVPAKPKKPAKKVENTESVNTEAVPQLETTSV